MGFDEGLAERIRVVLDARTDVEERRMFGGICFLVAGKMACGVMEITCSCASSQQTRRRLSPRPMFVAPT